MTDKDLSYFLTITREQRDFLESCVNELSAYKYIGALEECREAVEKQKPKKPSKGCGIFGETAYNCPYCGDEVRYLSEYCSSCGQKLDWED